MVSLSIITIVLRQVFQQLIAGDQCCYLYGSMPANDSVCAIGGRALGLSCYVYNPHIPFTDFTVRWFRSDNVTSMAPLTGEQIIESHEYQHYREYANRPIHGQTFNSCSNASIYRDAFFLVITNFTPDKNGYYWCQIVVNGTVSQPSQYVWIYAADNSSCTQPVPFVLMGEPQCAVFSINISSTLATPSVVVPTTISYYRIAIPSPLINTSILSTLATFSVAAPITTSMYSTSVSSPIINTSITPTSVKYLDAASTKAVTYATSSLSHIVIISTETPSVLTMAGATEPSRDQIAYVAGFLSAFTIVLASLVIILLLLFVCKSRRERRQQKGKTCDAVNNAIMMPV